MKMTLYPQDRYAVGPNDRISALETMIYAWLIPLSFSASETIAPRCSTNRVLLGLLGRVAVVAQRPVVVKLSRVRSVGPYVRTCVRRSVCPVHCGKTANRIRMPFGILGRTGPGMRQVCGV